MKKFFFVFLILALLFSPDVFGQQQSSEKMAGIVPQSDVFMQGFYWNSPPGGIWYDSLAQLAPRLASAGFSAIWFPPPCKGAGGSLSMGYDLYDHYDFGDYNQKGTRETRFGSKDELVHAIAAFHDVGIQVFADAVMSHMDGGEAEIPYECHPANYPDSAYLLFQYPNGSKRFPKDASDFYPNSQTCDVNPPYHGSSDPAFQFGVWLAKDRSFVRDSLIVWGEYLKKVIGFDGFRLDAVKSIDPQFMGPWLNAVNSGAYAVAEYFGSADEIKSWYSQTSSDGGGVSMFDFPLRFTLKDMCNNTAGTFDMNTLDGAGLVNAGMSGYNVSTFVENHDFDRVGWNDSVDVGHDPIITNKDMAYAYIIFSEGRPCVFFKDYFMYGLAGKIDTLIWIRQNFLGGGTTKRAGLNPYYIRQDGSTDQTVLSQDIYVARRDGYASQPGGYLVLNDNATQWIDVWVDTDLPVGTRVRDFTAHDVDKIVTTPDHTGGKNRVKLWAPPRSYTIYVADSTKSLNHPPVVESVTPQIAYTNSSFIFQTLASDADNDSLTYALNGNPSWLKISSAGKLFGTPVFGDTGKSIVVLTVQDPHAQKTIDTFSVVVKLNHAPKLSVLHDTTITATKRFELRAVASDQDNDSVSFAFDSAPAWLSVGSTSGIISGTPAVEDTGKYFIMLGVTDGKGAFDSTSFAITVVKVQDSIIATYGKPVIDGTVTVGSNDWHPEWLVVKDSASDSYWWSDSSRTMNNEIFGLYATWDSDSLYLGVDYYSNDKNNTLIVYVDAGIPGGVTDFNSNDGYNGDYPKNFLFPKADGIDFFVADYYLNQPSVLLIDSNATIDITTKIDGRRGPNARDLEVAIAWNDIYGLGAGLILKNAALKIVTIVAGGYNWGAGDAAPDNKGVKGDSGPDSLTTLATISPDKNGDGIPDPTVFIATDVKSIPASNAPERFALSQNYPNPFNPTTQLRFTIAELRFVSLKVFDVLGREVATLVHEQKSPGTYEVRFDGSQLTSGVYFVRMKAGNYQSAVKLMLLK